jgi:16S rRNA (cytosine1402-N4)-methyltransferase
MISLFEMLEEAPLAALPGVRQMTSLHESAAGGYHQPVLLRETLGLLVPAPGKLAVDGTLGGGGHTEAFLEAGADVIALDCDPEAVAFAKSRLARFGERVRIVHSNYAALEEALDKLDVSLVDIGLLDIGVSSHQIDEGARGFSFLKDGPLDMRMDPRLPLTAGEIVNHGEEHELARIFHEYGEEKNSRRFASRIVHRRKVRPFESTLDLAEFIQGMAPHHHRIHPATRVFQALRIAVNRELDVLTEGLEAFARRLRSGGRLGVITFHSLEDRIVKNFFKARSAQWIDRPEWPAPRPNPDYQFKLVTPKPVVACEEEQSRNPRSRSAKLRVIERI